ncbi:MAG: TIGR00159 family protein [candidate division Zixibacteria bacterium]|jgi:diadenylate cyclase|nr:TIGR00159 family protein [candidate division Zixibacteria bacterium]
MTLFHIGFLSFTLVDLIDVLLVGYFFYRLILLIRSVRSIELLFGLFIFFVVGVLSYWFDLSMVQWFISNIAAFGIIVLVIILQPELRRSFVRLGQNRLIRRLLKQESRGAVEDILRAVEKMSESRHGALLALENNINLASFVESGKAIGADVSHELIETIFTPYTPLHDGAIIIKGDQILAAACTLPLSQNPAYNRLYGMRHKAAVGLSEETDAFVIVVSEETGQVSYASEGRLVRGITLTELRDKLNEFYSN